MASSAGSKSMGDAEIEVDTVGEMVMEGLQSLDPVAFIRFASVYRDFREPKDFETFVGALSENLGRPLAPPAAAPALAAPAGPAAAGRRGQALKAPAPAVILVRPQLGVNIGAAARAMLNFGLTDLRLVAPRDGWPNADAGPAASGADEVLAGARVFDTVAEACAGLSLVFATTVRGRELTRRVVTPLQAAARVSRAGRAGRADVRPGTHRP